MGELYNRIVILCNEKGISGYKLCKDIGIQPSVLTDLKMGRQSGVSAKTASKISKYFGVNTEWLIGETDVRLYKTARSESDFFPHGNEKKPLVNDDEELTDILQRARDNPRLRMLFSLTANATPEDVEAAIKIIEALKERG